MIVILLTPLWIITSTIEICNTEMYKFLRGLMCKCLPVFIMTNLMHKFLIYFLSIYFCLTCFGVSFSPSSEAGVQIRQWFKSPGYGISARAPYPGDLNHCRSFTPAYEDGLKENPKHVRQK
jgi:hypothetical protein